MLEGYEDILSRISEPPIWYDQNGVPRYEKFHPNMCPNIYADKVVLAEIACQECGEKFLVEMHASIWSDRDASDPRKWHYGDPPRHCKGAGDTMNCEDIAIVECWHRSRPLREWKRVKKFEGLVDSTAFQQYVQRTAATLRKTGTKSKAVKAVKSRRR